jgi:RNA polymerase sigma-70 factor, ECF subfamily
MQLQDTHGITGLLAQWKNGDDEALRVVIPALYDELRRLAAVYVRRSHGETLQPTALVHELYLHIDGFRDVDWQSRGQFIAAAARLMRNILVENVRRRKSVKRGGGLVEPLEDLDVSSPVPAVDVLAIDSALDQLARDYPRHARVVELMFFGGLTAAEAAEVMRASGETISLRTVERDWRFARSWLHDYMAAA